MQKRKGFTLVELVIVIAVIAILAGVLIGTFASVLSKAQESAKMQEMKAAEHEQRATDLIKKIEDSNWLGWEDFEASIVEELTKVYKANSSASLTSEEVKRVVNEALATYLASHQTETTDLTAEQVKTIIENALGTIKYEGVTEAQVRAIVNASSTSILGSQLSASQVKSIVNAANANNLTANDLAKAIASLATTGTVTQAVDQIVNKINTTAATAATSEEVAAIKTLVEGLDKPEDINDIVTVKALNIQFAKTNVVAKYPAQAFEAAKINPYQLTGAANGKYIVWDSVNNNFALVDENGTAVYSPTGVSSPLNLWVVATAPSATFSTYYIGTASQVEVTTGFDDGTSKLAKITYTGASNVVIHTDSFETTLVVNTTASVQHYGNVGVIDIQKVAMASYHEYGNARVAKLAEGNLEVEASGIIALVQVEGTASTDTAKVNNKGTVEALVAPEAVATATTSVETEKKFAVAVTDETVALVNGEAKTTLSAEDFASGTVILLKDYTPATAVELGSCTVIGSLNKLKATITGNETIVLKNIHTTGLTVENFTGTLTLDGGLLESTNVDNEAAAIQITTGYGAYIFKNMTVAANTNKGIKISNAKSVTIDNCVFDATELAAVGDDESHTRSLSAIDIQEQNETDGNKMVVTITGCKFNGVPQGSQSYGKDTDTAAAIKLKAEKQGFESVTITNNEFDNCYRDVAIGVNVYKESNGFSDGKTPALMRANAVDAKFVISGNTTTHTSEDVKDIGYLTFKNTTNSTGESEKVGSIVGGCAVFETAKSTHANDDQQ